MRQRRVALGLALGIVVLCIGVAADQRGAPPPAPGSSPASTPATGTGLIVGRILDANGDKPMAGAAVTIVPAGSQATTAFRPASVVTGSDGVFVFRNLPKGPFAIGAVSPGYMYQSPGSNPMTMITLDDGEKINDVVVRLWRFGAISGQVVDEQGEGVEGITISVIRGETSSGRSTLNSQTSAVTDDRGFYRVISLAPGDYTACALFSRRIAPTSPTMMEGNADMQRTISGSGGQPPSGSGYRVGDFVMISSSGSRNVDPSPGEDGRMVVFADACYPSAPTVQAAQLVRVASGQERSDLNLVLRIVPSVRIMGTVTGPANRIVGMGVHLYPAAPGESSITNAIEAANTLTDQNGNFGFIGVPAGSYVARAVYRQSPDFAMQQQMLIEMAGQGAPPELLARLASATAAGPPAAEPALWASAAITVGDSDINGVSLNLREAFRVTGRVVFEGTQPRPAADRMPIASIGITALDPVGTASYAQPRGQFAADGTFTASAVLPGRYLLAFQGAWPGWTLKSIVTNGRDVSDDPLDVTNGDVTDVVVTLTDRPAQLAGTVRDDSGVKDARARVLVFPADRTRWTQVSAGRRLSNAVVSKDGTFTVTGLPAGEYFVVAVGNQAVVNWQEPKTLDVLSRLASRTTVRDGERRTLDLVTSVIR